MIKPSMVSKSPVRLAGGWRDNILLSKAGRTERIPSAPAKATTLAKFRPSALEPSTAPLPTA
ncbi:hypothetical protein MishRS11D_45360 (plasmid) [Methylomagnum ishizawai]|nr:hypothetical protein MishRS11D_45360 [Methylomagnum ishizawai]